MRSRNTPRLAMLLCCAPPLTQSLYRGRKARAEVAKLRKKGKGKGKGKGKKK
jgi:hypothetical protein